MKMRSNYKNMSLAFACMLLLPSVSGHAAETTRVSVDSAGIQGDLASIGSSISADGTLVVFASDATNLVDGDTNSVSDIFIRNKLTDKTTRVSVSSAGLEGNAPSFAPKISANGVFVVFASNASNLVTGDNNGRSDIFVHNRLTGITTLVSKGFTGKPGNGDSLSPAINANGQIIAFDSFATNLVSGDTNGKRDVFVHNRANGKTVRVSVDSAGVAGNLRSLTPAINASGNLVAFASKATNLIPPGQDNNGVEDIFTHNLVTKKTVRVSVDSAGNEGNAGSSEPALNANGDVVAFASESALEAADTNLINDIYVRNLKSGKTTRVSVSSAGQQANLPSNSPAISADGLIVAFKSSASNLIIGDTNFDRDIFIHNRLTGITNRVSVDTLGKEANLDSISPAISAEGRYVAFQSLASNLVPNDTNNVSDIFVRDRLLQGAQDADIALAVTNKPDSVQKGQTASYTFTIKNNGPDNATNVALIDIVSRGRVVTMTPSQGVCTKGLISVCRFGSLASGASATLTVDVKALANPIVQQLSVSASPQDNVPANNKATVSTPVTP